MVLQKLWVSQNFSRISRVSQSRFLSGYVRLVVSFFIRRCFGVSKHVEVSVSQSKKSKCLGFAKKNASLAVTQSLAFTIRHPNYKIIKSYWLLLIIKNHNKFMLVTRSTLSPQKILKWNDLTWPRGDKKFLFSWWKILHEWAQCLYR